MMSFLAISKIVVEQRFVQNIYDHLREVGGQGLEGVGLWLGEQESTIFHVRASVIPKQTALHKDNGLLYHVDGEELHRINVWAYRQKLLLFAQLHSHPGEAYHSDTDDDYPMVTALGSFSIVIPDFGFGPIDAASWKVYRLHEEGWKELAPEAVTQIFEIR